MQPSPPPFAGPPPPAENEHTVAALLADAETRIRDSGSDAPELTALILLEHATGWRRETLIARDHVDVPSDARRRYDELVGRRCRREPLAYILGFREFFGRSFEVTPDTLVPRPETEGLVELALAHLYQRRMSLLYPVALDVGTGSGAIAVTLLAEVPTLQAVAMDVDLAPLKIAARNARLHGVEDRLRLVNSNLAEAINRRFDLVLANLPYVPSAELATLEPEVQAYEPTHALDGGPDGTRLIRAFLPGLGAVLEPGGVAILEIGEDQGAELALQIVRRYPGWSASVQPDPTGRERYLVVERPL